MLNYSSYFSNLPLIIIIIDACFIFDSLVVAGF